MKKKLMLFALMLSLGISSAGVCSAADNYEDVGENQSEWTEQLDRGLVAVPTQNGVYLSWRLQADEDNRFGDGDSNVSFDIYRDGEKIATETNTTNYLDANGTKDSKYSVVSSNETEENLTNTRTFHGPSLNHSHRNIISFFVCQDGNCIFYLIITFRHDSLYSSSSL